MVGFCSFNYQIEAFVLKTVSQRAATSRLVVTDRHAVAENRLQATLLVRRGYSSITLDPHHSFACASPPASPDDV